MSFQIQLLSQSLEQIRPREAEFATHFYQHLFTRHPEMQPYFAHTDMAKQQQMLVAALFLIIKSLEKPQMLATLIKGLAERHRRYGALTEQFPHVGEALMAAFAFLLGSDWTPEMQQAWQQAYEAITQQMIVGMGDSRVA
ncbi:MAG: globin domain-containing protein [Elainella sp.]